MEHKKFSEILLYLGIPVAEIAMDGLYTTEQYMNHTLGIGPKNLTDFTACIRFNLNFLRGKFTTMISLTSWFSDNAFVMDLKQTSPYGSIKLNAAKYYFTINDEILSHDFGARNIHQKWHHICFSLEYNLLNDGKRESIMNLYHDGKVVQKGT